MLWAHVGEETAAADDAEHKRHVDITLILILLFPFRCESHMVVQDDAQLFLQWQLGKDLLDIHGWDG